MPFSQPKSIHQISTKIEHKNIKIIIILYVNYSKVLRKKNSTQLIDLILFNSKIKMSNLPLIDNKLTTIYHRNKRNILIEFSTLNHNKTNTTTKIMQINIVEYLCVHRQNMPISISSEIVHLSSYQNQSNFIFQDILYIGDILQANGLINFIISCRIKLIFEIYNYPKQNKDIFVIYFS